MTQYDADREEVIRRAELAGVEIMITVASDLGSGKAIKELAEKYENVYYTVGLHPHDAKDLSNEVFEKLKTLSAHPKAVAIGETGLDYHYMHSQKAVQQFAFKRQLSLAIETNLPVIVHSREAEDDTMAMLAESGVKKGVLHCFSGDMKMADKAMKMGLLISIAGPVTFKKSIMLKDVARRIPDDFLLIETDAPYLTPEPMRGKRNEPSYIVNTAKEIASLRGITLEDLARITTLNARRLFDIGVESAFKPVIAYQIRDSLYLNLTNRCTNKCAFCVRNFSDYVKGHYMRLDDEPSAEALIAEIGDPKRFKEVVFCGYGEPLIRLDTVKQVAKHVKENGGSVRINTNGHGSILHKRNILPELDGLVDVLSISLDAQDAETYDRLCKPAIKGAYEAVLDFIREAKKHVPTVVATVVELDGVDIEACKKIADEFGVGFRVRKLDVVG